MNKKIDGQMILKKLKEKNNKKRISLYITESTHKEFQKACKDIPSSQVIEELMENFIKSFKN